MTGLSTEQQAIVQLPLRPLAVTACAGSGKTKTAVHRLAHVRRLDQHGHNLVALLSFSNVAVDTFRTEYSAATRGQPPSQRGHAVEIDTMDGFITTNVLRPHGHRTMACDRTPFLVDGREPFLKSFTVFDGQRSHPTAGLGISLKSGIFSYVVGQNNPQTIATRVAEAGLVKLGETGAFTHASARYWVLRTLKEQPFVLRALVRRYPHILVDEAQDIGPEHQAVLELMIGGGSQVSLIGDASQAIYEFAQADGAFLATYGDRAGIERRNLSVNFRSVPSILGVANRLTGRADTADRDELPDRHAAYYLPFKPGDRGQTLDAFQNLLQTHGIRLTDGVILCRSADWAAEWNGEQDGQGVGVIRCFANSAISRDQLGKLRQAYEQACVGVVGLLAKEHGSLLSKLVGTSHSETRTLRRTIWSFVRDPLVGLPSASLAADTDWHPLLCARVRALLIKLEAELGLKPGDNLGQKLARKALENRPLAEMPDLAQIDRPPFRVSTVHKAKGESLKGVMYVASKAHARGFLNGTGTEVGRIGYVALTRACDLFVLAIPEAGLSELEDDLQAAGLRRAGKSALDL